AYKIEFADQIINVYFNGTAVDTDIVTPYLEDDLFQLQFKQSADVMWIVHPTYNPRKLSRVSATEFSLDKIPFETGPFIERNDIAENDDVTLRVDGYSTDITATAGDEGTGKFTFTVGTDISALFPENKRFYMASSTGNDGAYTISSSTTGGVLDFPTDYTATTLTIFANENIPDGTNDGEIMVDGGEVMIRASVCMFVNTPSSSFSFSKS
ncbi:hypothetical protein LCGC14_2994320, partial [marine sediment metagenome]